MEAEGRTLQVCEYSLSRGIIDWTVTSAFWRVSASISFIVSSDCLVPAISFAGETTLLQAFRMSGSVASIS